jgi:integrase/recombinase XerD
VRIERTSSTLYSPWRRRMNGCLFQFFLGLGPREQEVMYAHWSDVDFVDGIYKVTAHPSKFKPKDYEEREIPFPDHLVAALRERQREAKYRLIFPTPSGKPDGHMLRKLKALAQRAGLDPTKFGLHVFRTTFATLLHRAGIDARTIQQRLGHSNLETTLLYLEGENARSQKPRQGERGVWDIWGQARREL